MPYRPEAELKRPDLKGEFLCGHCGKTFCHAASLNRHRLNFHGDDQQCLLCNTQIPQNDTVRRHMLVAHQITRVFTCGCCNWTFPDKKELHSHNNAMLKTGNPGDAKAIAVSSRAPGSLSQHELRGEERTPRAKKRASKASTPVVPEGGDSLMALLNQIIINTRPPPSEPSTSAPPVIPVLPTAIPASWLSNLLVANPLLAPFLSASSMAASPSSASSTTSTSEIENEEKGREGTSKMALDVVNNNAEEEENSANEEEGQPQVQKLDVKDLLMQTVGPDFLSVVTQQTCSNSVSSSAESGIGSAPHSNTPSPVSSIAGLSSASPSDLLQTIAENVKKANKRRSIDDICTKLIKKAR